MVDLSIVFCMFTRPGRWVIVIVSFQENLEGAYHVLYHLTVACCWKGPRLFHGKGHQNHPKSPKWKSTSMIINDHQCTMKRETCNHCVSTFQIA